VAGVTACQQGFKLCFFKTIPRFELAVWPHVLIKQAVQGARDAASHWV
jgi:hypothetical protein